MASRIVNPVAIAESCTGSPAKGSVRQRAEQLILHQNRRPVMLDPDAAMPRLNRTLVYLGACIIAGLRLAKERQVNIRVIPTRTAIEESVELAHEIFYQVFRKVPDHIEQN